jgi:hypothetical protein
MVAEVLKMAKADETGRQARHDGCGFHGFTAYRFVRPGYAQRAGCGNVQTMHGFTAQKFTNAGAQYCTTISHTGKGRESGAFELYLLASCFTQQNGPTIAELTCPHTELVAAVNARQWVSSFYRSIAR